jgi:hypothetical protein
MSYRLRVALATPAAVTLVRDARGEQFVWKCRGYLIGRLNVPGGFAVEVYDYREGVVTTLHYADGSFVVLQAGGMYRIPLFQDPEHKLLSSTEQETKTTRAGKFVNSELCWREDNFKPRKHKSKVPSILILFPPNIGYGKVPLARRAEFDRALDSFVREGEPTVNPGRQ